MHLMRPVIYSQATLQQILDTYSAGRLLDVVRAESSHPRVWLHIVTTTNGRYVLTSYPTEFEFSLKTAPADQAARYVQAPVLAKQLNNFDRTIVHKFDRYHQLFPIMIRREMGVAAGVTELELLHQWPVSKIWPSYAAVLFVEFGPLDDQGRGQRTLMIEGPWLLNHRQQVLATTYAAKLPDPDKLQPLVGASVQTVHYEPTLTELTFEHGFSLVIHRHPLIGDYFTLFMRKTQAWLGFEGKTVWYEKNHAENHK